MRLSNPVDLIILNKENQVLLCKRAENEHGQKGKWSIPGGGPEPDEGFEDAIHREIKEELGCEISWLRYFKSYCMRMSDKQISRSVYFYGEVDGEIQLNDELSDHKWVDLDDPGLLNENLAFNQKEVLRDFIRFLGNGHQSA